MAAVLGLAAGVLGTSAPDKATAAPGALARLEPLSVTFVARSCEQYSQVMANKARNNLQESLRDLGPDSNYDRSETVSAQKEAAGTPLPPCKPLPGWTFSTGTGLTAKTPASLQLSTATGVIRQNITTTAGSIPELDAQGMPTGRTLEGAVTVPLTPAEIKVAATGWLVVQGGTPSQPLNGMQEQYGFAALRCAQDAINGDNVEYVSFPADARHVFCYYYAVTPPPSAGTITVVKEVAPDSPGQGTFRFDGNISYADTNGDGVNDFLLTASAGKSSSMTFVRGETRPGDAPWQFQEIVTPGSGWLPPTTPACTIVNANGGAGTSAVSVDSTGKASVVLAAGDNVTCTYTNRRTSGTALLEKETIGGTGTFAISLGTPPGVPPTNTTPVTTVRDGVPITVAQAPAGITPGTYTATEVKPAPDGTGTWQLTGANCNGTDVPITETATTWSAAYDVAAAGPVKCLLTNTFTPGGAIYVEKVSQGGTGTFGYAVTPHSRVRKAGPDDSTYHGSASTTAEGTPADAVRPDGTPGPLADKLVVGDEVRYTIQEFLPPTSDAGYWKVTSVDCGGAETSPLDAAAATVQIRLTAAQPRPTCRFTNTYQPSATLEVVKTTSGDTGLRPAAAQLEATCATGQSGRLTVPVGDTSATTGQYILPDPITCTIAETASGAAAGVDVATSATLTTGPADPGSPYRLGESFTVRPGQNVRIAIDNVLKRTPPDGGETPPPTAPPGEPPPGTPPPAPAPGGSHAVPAHPAPPDRSAHATTAHTGADGVHVLVLLSLVFLALGTGTLLLVRRPRA
ncbi:prealbumin-like fold domain-containing protein [Yinghuangia soli]|uniref:SpaA-like prealbumin fold domain-containing protein n=1 Tax=Yinghuangia soli TaxID=2908204 RepID=A0AA41Q1Z8_9ACTN|nr:hypothetical protein [Yinghuangia soli]MCF2529460.1 hypothetical protein [Yinghuangia soli]